MVPVDAVTAPDGGRAVPRLLLITERAPSDSHVGGIFLRDLCLLYRPGALAVCIISDDEFEWPASLAHVPYQTVWKPPSRGLYGFGRHVTRWSRAAFEIYVRSVLLRRLANDVLAIAKQAKPDMIWMPLVGPATIGTAAALANAVGVPLVTTVWDTPETYLQQATDLDSPGARKPYLKLFASALRRSVRCGVMSEAMGAAYAAKYGVRPVIMRHGIAASHWREPKPASRSSDHFVIGYAGSLYATREWEALLAALSAVSWTIAGRPVTIRVYNGTLDVSVNGPVRIDFRGWNSVEATMDGLAEVDVSYLPYWFDEGHQLTTRLAFPTKLTTYLAAGAPVLFHGPSYASPAAFLSRYPAGISCHSHAAHDIVRSLERFLDADFRARAATAMRRACEEELGLHVFRDRFAELIGIPVDQLLPAA